MTELVPVGGGDNAHRKVDVVFVHGLDGDARNTWSAGKRPENFWPMWLSKDVPDAGVWSFGYLANASAWLGPAMPITDRASNMLGFLEAARIGERPLVFVTHSMGGLIVKQALRHGRDFNNPKWRAIVDQTKGVVFLSTPHSGADVASFFDRLNVALQLNINVRELRNHDRRLSELGTWYRLNADTLGIRTLAFCENEPWNGVIVVDKDSAEPGIGVAYPIDANHETICKPSSKEGVYTLVMQFVGDCLAAPPLLPRQSYDERRNRDADIRDAATDLLDALEALDNAIRGQLAELILFRPDDWHTERREHLIREINGFAHREELIVTVRRSLRTVNELMADIHEDDRALVGTITDPGVQLLSRLSGSGVTPFADLDALAIFLDRIRDARTPEDAQAVIAAAKQVLGLLDREALARADEALGALQGHYLRRHSSAA